MKTPIIISIDGNIGSGKSTLFTYLKEYYKNDTSIGFLEEPVDQWNSIKDENDIPILKNLYGNPSKYAFRFQMMAYISRLSLLRKKIKTNKFNIIITERSVNTDKNVFAKMLYDDKMIEHDEYSIYNMWFNEFLENIKIAGIIYVCATPNTCFHRIKKRNRYGEENVPIEYLEKCHNYHESWITNEVCETFTLNCETNNEDHKNFYDNSISQINEWINDSLILKNIDPFTLYFDGACRKNPSSLLGIGFLFKNLKEEIIFEHCEAINIENGTNNISEYMAMIKGLKYAYYEKNIRNLIVKGDSLLVISQMNNNYKVKNEELIKLHKEATELANKFDFIKFIHIKREENTEADLLSNQAYKRE